MKKLLLFLFIAADVLLIDACQKPLVDISHPVSGSERADYKSAPVKPISVVDGRLVFATGKIFLATLKELEAIKDYKKYSVWESKYEGYKSTRTAFEEWNAKSDAAAESTVSEIKNIVKKAKSVDGTYDYQRIIPDDLLATLISKDGLIQVGDTVCLVTELEIRKTLSKSIEQLNVRSSGQLVISPVVKLPIKLSSKESANGRLASTLDQDSYDEIIYNFSGDDYRFRSNWWAIRYNIFQSYMSTGITIDHQRRGTFSWRTSNAFNWNGIYSWKITSEDNMGVVYTVLDLNNITAQPLYDYSSYQPFRTQYSPSPPPFRVSAVGYWGATGRNGLSYYRQFLIETTTN